MEYERFENESNSQTKTTTDNGAETTLPSSRQYPTDLNRITAVYQPQVVVLTRPSRGELSPDRRRQQRLRAFITGGIQIAGGLIILVVGMMQVKFVTAGHAADNFIAAPLLFATALLAILAGINTRRSLKIASLVMTVVTAVIVGVCFVYSLSMACGYGVRMRSKRYRDKEHYLFFHYAVVTSSLLTVTHIIMMITSIVQSGFACASVCRCCQSSDDDNETRMAYLARQDHNGQLTMDQQAVPVLNLKE